MPVSGRVKPSPLDRKSKRGIMVECPYCHSEQEPNEDRSTETAHKAECYNCGKLFVYTVEISVEYSSREAPCLNGGTHDLQDIIGWPSEYFANRRRCSVCDLEVVLEAV